ncbi:MAG: ROK family protein [Dysgonomonas sp.]|nr:ROK family protein [Dysgonomonas sp.]
MEPTYLALDLGATKLLIGEVDSKGKILRHKRYETGYINQITASAIIKRSLEDYMTTVGWATDKRPASMGVGLIGRVDNANGIWLQIDPKRNQAISLAQELSDLYGFTCYIDNDVKAATRAVKKWGYGKGSDNFIYINIGTGIAAGFFINGQLVRGSHFNAGEVGHTNGGVNIGIKCSCGRDNCVEQIAGGLGFDKSARLLSKVYKTKLHIPENENIRVDVKEVYFLCQQNDELCVQLVENAAQGIASLIMNLVRVSDPDTVVLGGGIVSSGFIYQKVLEKLNKTTIRFVSNGVLLTQLDPNFAGLIGAAAVAMNE